MGFAGFWLKKFISGFLLPLPLGLLLLVFGFVLLLFQRAKKTHITSFIVGFSLIFLSSLNLVSHALLHPLQTKYAPLIIPPKTVAQVVVLGGGVGGNKNLPPNLTLSAASLSRLVEGIRLFKLVQNNHPNAQLILSGGRAFRSPAVAGKMQNTAVILGVNNQNTVLENGSLDTHDEAIYLQKTLGTKPFILVTSGYHMPRAMALFEALGMHPIAAPTQFIEDGSNVAQWITPNSNSIFITDIAIHEYLGILWAKLRGFI